MGEWYTSSTGNLTEAQKQNNADIIYSILSAKGYHLNTIAGICGNIENESNFSPTLVEAGDVEKRGYGLLQWTPQSNLTDACSKLGLSPYTDGTVQINVLDGELFVLKNQWYTETKNIRPYYPSGADSTMIGVTPQEFKENSMNQTPAWLAIMFMVGYERPSYDTSKNHYDRRINSANKWYTYFSGHEPPEPPTPTPTPTDGKRRKMWKYLRRPVVFY